MHVWTGVVGRWWRVEVPRATAQAQSGKTIGQQLEREREKNRKKRRTERVAKVGSSPIVIKTLTAAGTAKSIVPRTTQKVNLLFEHRAAQENKQSKPNLTKYIQTKQNSVYRVRLLVWV